MISILLSYVFVPAMLFAGQEPGLSGDVRDIVSFELSKAKGEVAKSDVDGDGKAEKFVIIAEKSGGITYKNIVKVDGKDTLVVAGFPVFEGEKTYISMGFADVTGDGYSEALVAFSSTSLTSSALIFMDMANPEDGEATEFVRLAPSYPVASSFEVNWPQVIARSPDGDRDMSYTWDGNAGVWVAEQLNWVNWEPER